mgnify:CR=1 FL=1
MKKILIGLVTALVVFAGLGIYMTNKIESESIYNTMTKVEEIKQNDKEYVLYFSSPYCSYCEQVEPQIKEYMKEFEAAKIPFYLMDMSTEGKSEFFKGEKDVLNKDYYFFAKDIPKNFDLNKFKIAGTPSAIHVKDGKIIDISVGVEFEFEFQFRLMNNVGFRM